MGTHRKAKAEPSWSKAQLDRLIEEATVDAYGESEQRTGFFTMIEEHLDLPFDTRVLGAPVTVERIDLTRADEDRRDLSPRPVPQPVPILDLPLPKPLAGGRRVGRKKPTAAGRAGRDRRCREHACPGAWGLDRARKRHGLSHAQVQMAREAGHEPQEARPTRQPRPGTMEAPSPRLHRTPLCGAVRQVAPDIILSIEERARLAEQKQATRKEARRLLRQRPS